MITFSYRIMGHGWSDVTIADETNEVRLEAWEITDALKDFVDTLIRVMRGSPRATCTWEHEHEQGQYRWVLERQGDDVQITILWFDRLFSARLDDAGAPIFSTRCPLRKFAMVVLNELWRLHHELGLDGYRTQSGRYEFPLAEYKTLEQLIRTYPPKGERPL